VAREWFAATPEFEYEVVEVLADGERAAKR
jgi:hypothetical protein